MMNGLWYKVPGKLMDDERATKADIKVFAYVADRLKGIAGVVSVGAICKATELSRRQVQLSLRKLIACGYLAASERAGRATLYMETWQRTCKAAADAAAEDPNEGEEVSA